MARSLTALLLCFHLTIVSVAQQTSLPTPSPSPLQSPEAPKPPQQEPKKEDLDVVRITTNLIQVDAVVLDSKGKRVTDLRPDEVEMIEDGKTQKITNFSYVSLGPTATKQERSTTKAVDVAPAPPVRLRPEQVRRTIALMVDDLGLSFESVNRVRSALKKFVDEQMQPEDLVAVLRTGGGMGALQQFTSDKRLLHAAIDRVRWNPNGRATISPFAPLESGPAGSTSVGPPQPGDVTEDLNQFRQDVYAVGTLGALSYVVRGLTELPGRKSVVLFSDGIQIFSSGDPYGSQRILTALRHLTDLANRASVVIYTMDARGLQYLGLTAQDSTSGMSTEQVEQQLSDRRFNFFESQSGLHYLAVRTGGIPIRNTNDVNGAIKQVLADQEGFYLIGYQPDASTFSPVRGRTQFHQISLKVKRPGKYTVRMRNGFYGVTEERLKAAVATPQQQLVNALISPFGASGVQLRLTSLFINDQKIGSAMQSFLHVNANDIDFEQQPDGSFKAVFDLMALAFGDNGLIVEQFNYTQTLGIKKEDFARLQKNGFTYTVIVPIKKAGAYQFRTALRDRASGRVGAASQFIEVPDIKKDRLMVSGIVMKGMTLESYLKNAGASVDDKTNESVAVENLPNASPAVRQFRNGLALAYAFSVYNAQIDKTTGRPKLKVQVRVFRNGEELFKGKQFDFDPGDQADMKRLIVNGGIQLGSNMAPGEYVLQVIATDVVKAKPRVASQWLDFEIVK